MAIVQEERCSDLRDRRGSLSIELDQVGCEYWACLALEQQTDMKESLPEEVLKLFTDIRSLTGLH